MQTPQTPLMNPEANIGANFSPTEPDVDDKAIRNTAILSLISFISLLFLPLSGCVLSIWMWDPFNSYWVEYSYQQNGLEYYPLFVVPGALMMLYCCVQSFRGRRDRSVLPSRKLIRRLCLISATLVLLSIVQFSYAAESVARDHTADGYYGTDDAGVELESWYPHVGYFVTPVLLFVTRSKSKLLPSDGPATTPSLPTIP